MSRPDYETVIGLEVHAQLLTRSKLFSPMAATYGEAPNSRVNEICAGLPGVLPVLNREAVSMAIKAGLALGCKIRHDSRFARKNYFYPDLPKGYQISQYEQPLCEHGRLAYELDGQERSCGITRIHLEEDAGKSVHLPGEGFSRVDLNRAGVPLLEIVSEPDIRSPDQAAAYLRELRAVLVALEVCDGNMEEGSLRCDGNISVRRRGETSLGTKVELKNMNSFKFLKDALAYEQERQVASRQAGEPVHQETRLWDTDARRTIVMRRKEGSDDYRYFPDPDLPPLTVSQAWIAAVAREMVELPADRRRRYRRELGIPAEAAGALAASPALAEYFDAAVAAGGDPRTLANWTLNEVMAVISSEADLPTFAVAPDALSELVGLLDAGDISGPIAKKAFAKAVETGDRPARIVEREGLRVVRDLDRLGAIIDQVLVDNPLQVEEYRGGKTKLRGYFVGQVMRATRGKADPKLVQTLLEEKLSS